MPASSTPEGLVKGHWQIGPRSRTFLVLPPAGKVVTHRGTDLRTGATVSLMLLRPPWDRSRRVRDAQLHGAKQLRALDHPHVVKVHDVIDDDDLFAVVTEPLLGDNLNRHISSGAAFPTEAEVVRVLRELAGGLQHAHDRGVVFGNVKPTNVEVLPDGTVKLFPLAKPPHEFTSFLDAADYLGSPVYCSPEVLRCEPLDGRADVYGLGLCAYALIVARLPYQLGGNLSSDLRLLETQEWPAPAEVVEEVHPRLSKVVARCLRKDRAQRYPTVAALLEDLERVQPRSEPLISAARLLEVVTSAFPAPLAALAQVLERDDHLLAQRGKLLNLANGLLCYLGFLAAQALGKPLGREYARPSLGHWVGLVRQALQGEAAGPLAGLRGAAELLKALDDVVRLRNRMAHAPSPEEGALLHEWVTQMTACVRRLYRALLFLAGWSLVVAEDLDFQGERFVLGLRRLDGLGEHAAVVSVESDTPYTRGRAYLAAKGGGPFTPLHPWVVFTRCPLCQQRELFFYVSLEGGQAHYVTPDRGHNWSCSAPAELAALVER